MPPTAFESRRILGTRVDSTSYDAATRQILEWATAGRSCYVCLAAVNNIMEARRSSAYRAVMDQAELVTSDGMPLVWALRNLGIGDATRVYGPDLTPRVLEAAAAANIPVGFYGGSEIVLPRLLAVVRNRFPALQIAFAEAPPFRPLTPEEDERAITAIRKSGARILFVGLGSPKQDRWMYGHTARIPAVMLGVGAAFDFLAGTKRQAPLWMQDRGLEWAFRLATEPRRLWRRYLTQNPRFLILATAQIVRSPIRTSPMSTAARPAITVRPVVHATSGWTPWIVFAADVLALECSFGLGLATRRMLSSVFTVAIGLDQYIGIAIAMLLLPLVNFQLNLYPGYLLAPVERLRRRTLATLSVFGGLAAWDSLVARGMLSRGVLLATLFYALILPPLAELAARTFLIRRKLWGLPVVLLGAGPAGRALARTLQQEPALGLHPIAFLDNRGAWNTSVEGVPVAGPLRFATEFEGRASAAIVCLADLSKADASTLLHELNFPRLIVLPDLAGAASLWVSARHLGGSMGFEIKKNLLLRRNHILKRCMDQAIALPLFLISLPILAIAAVWIKLASRGPAFYRQVREGFDGRRIAVWKLRTMHMDGDRILEHWFESHPEDRERWQRFFKLHRDPRVLPIIGPLLRRTSLDELPQLWSILCGEMSLVGPRPLPDYHLDQFPPEFRTFRTRVLPGLTGLWQVSKRDQPDVATIEAIDSFYIRNWSPWLDLYILIRTVTAVLLARGAY